MPITAPYGSWESPITTDLIVQDSVSLGSIQIDGDDVYWVEMRPQEGARNVIVRRTQGGEIQDVTPEPYNVRTRVHEYGGLCFWVLDGVAFSPTSQTSVFIGRTQAVSPSRSLLRAWTCGSVMGRSMVAGIG